LRGLAARYAEYANGAKNAQRELLHRAVNNNKAQRPIVLAEEIPWHEIDDASLALQCADPRWQGMEQWLRRNLWHWENLDTDLVLRRFVSVRKQVDFSSIGVEKLVDEHSSGKQAVAFVDQLAKEEALAKLTNQTLTYDAAATQDRAQRVMEMVGDILPVQVVGLPSGYGLGHKPWDDISFLRGDGNIMEDLFDRPEFMHATVARLVDIFLDTVEQMNAQELWDTDVIDCHCASALCDDLHPDREHPHSKGIWGRALAQILACVSPAMHDEFDIQYAIRAMEPFGLVYYGCCEPLDRKIDILSQIPNLRKISITPWADYERACSQIAGKWVVSAKPHPAAVAGFDAEGVEKELRHILGICRAHSCACEMVLKDISTINGDPQNLIQWSRLAMRLAHE